MNHSPWQSQQSLTEAKVKSILEYHYPELGKFGSIQKLGEGWDNTTWLVNEAWVFRFPKRLESVGLLQNEIAILSQLPEFTIQTPKPEWITRNSPFYPYPFYGHRYLVGTPADHMNLTDEERNALAEPLAHFLKTLHYLPQELVINDGISSNRERGVLSKRYQETKERLGYLQQHELISDITPWLTFFKMHQEVKTSSVRVLGHGDLYARHLLLDNHKQLTAIIDWGDAELLHPAIDLRVVYQFFPEEGQANFWQHYGEVDKTTLLCAELLAIYSSATLTWYGHQVQDAALLREGLIGLERLNPKRLD